MMVISSEKSKINQNALLGGISAPSLSMLSPLGID